MKLNGQAGAVVFDTGGVLILLNANQAGDKAAANNALTNASGGQASVRGVVCGA